jgi:dTDP-4-amino-4,6-dideoxygalactose transaminase
LQLPHEAEWASSTFWMYTVLVDNANGGIDSRQLLKRLAEHKIQTRPLWQPLHLSPAHFSPDARACPTSEALYRDALSLPCSVGLSQADQDRCVEKIKN